MVKVTFFFSVVVTTVMASTASYSATINCERTTSSYQGYKDFAAFESWWPKNIDLDGNDFTEAGKGSKAMVYENIGGEKASGTHFTRKYRLLPNNLMIGAVKPFGNYASVSNIRYKCDINSNELRAKLAEGGAEPSTAVSSSSKMDKAKSTCTDLGFSDGTEKHGECVLKLFGENDEATSIINTPRWLKVRQSGSSDLYVDKKGQYIKIKAASKWYNQLHDRYSKEPNTDIRIGFYFTNDKSYKPKKYDFETIKPSEIQATEEGNAKVFTFKTTAVAKLRSLESKYIIFLVTDFEEGMYFWTRTTKSK